MTNNFWWNRHWTFSARDGHAGFQAARFLVVSVVAFVFAAMVLELLVTSAISGAFLVALLTGRWDGGALEHHAWAIGGLIVGGLIAAPFAGWITKRVPAKVLTYMVGGLIVLLAGYQGLQIAGVAP